MPILTLVPIYPGEHRPLLAPLGSRLGARFGCRVRTAVPWFEPERAYEPSRGQYHSTTILAGLLTRDVAPGERRLAITAMDLFVPVLTFVFGEAQLDGTAAIVSTHRLRNEAYGMPPDPDLLTERLVKEAIHELGHTHGLVHCLHAICVMRSSTYVEEIDLKRDDFCAACADVLQARRAAVG